MNIETVIEWAHRPLRGADCVLAWVTIPWVMFGAIAAYVATGVLWQDGHKWRCIIARAIFAFFWPVTVPIYLATWPIRKARGWWKRRNDKKLGIVRHKGYVFMCGTQPELAPPVYSWTPLADPPKPIAPTTPYGSKPSGEPEWRRALDELENTILPTLASHHERIAALEGGKRAEAVEWRVFSDATNHFQYICREGVEVAVWSVSSPSLFRSNTPKSASWFSTDKYYTELHGPEKDAIVASYLALRGK